MNAFRKNKYGNKKVTVDGIRFDSIAESKRYGELKLLERDGQITMLKVHPKFPMIVNGAKVCTYIADFSYYDIANKKTVQEDVKGKRTALYSLKKKLFEAVFYPMTITEIAA